MNTAGSVAYGWGALIVAAGVSFYFAKKEIDGRRREQARKGSRPVEKMTWEEKIAQSQPGQSAGGDAAPGRTSIPTTFPGGGDKPTMQSKATGVDTSKSSAGSRSTADQ